MFSQVSVYLSVLSIWSQVPSPAFGPRSFLGEGVPLSRVTGSVQSLVPGPAGGGYPSQESTGVPPGQDRGYPNGTGQRYPPDRTGGQTLTGQGVPPLPRQESKGSYASGGIHLAVTQEDFLGHCNFRRL